MKIIFCGTPSFAVPSLKTLIASSHQVLAVVTQPDRPAGRGRKLHTPPVKDTALAAGLPVLQPARIGQSLKELRELEPDVLVVVAYGQLLPKSILDLPKYGCINVHASLLPSYRGAAPINRAIINGDKTTGISTMRLDEGMDTGDVILSQPISIDSDETAGSLHDKLAVLGPEVLLATLDLIEANNAPYTPQDNSYASYAPLINKEDTVIDWQQPAQKIDCLVRGLIPFPGARTFLNNAIFKILAVEISGEDNNSAEPGQIIATDHKKGILVATGSVPLWIKQIQPPSRSRMQATDYLAGIREDLKNSCFKNT